MPSLSAMCEVPGASWRAGRDSLRNLIFRQVANSLLDVIWLIDKTHLAGRKQSSHRAAAHLVMFRPLGQQNKFFVKHYLLH